MQVEKTELPGVVVVTPPRFEDSRGFFSETWNRRRMSDAGLEHDWVQDNLSLSRQAFTLRGLHFQYPPRAQAKLVRCARGRALDVAVDIRRGSPTFRKWIRIELSAENGRQILIPMGFLHGFVTLEPNTEIAYKCSEFYDPACDSAVRFDSDGLAVDWTVDPGRVVLSDKDASAMTWENFDTPFEYVEAAS